MGLHKSDWILTAKLVAAGGPFAFIVGAVLAWSAQEAIQTPLPTFPPSSPIVIVVPPSPQVKETTVPRHAATEKPSTIAPAPAAPKPRTSAPEPTTTAAPEPTTTAAPEPTTTAAPAPTTTAAPVAPSDTPIYDGLVQENIGRDPSYEAPHEGR